MGARLTSRCRRRRISEVDNDDDEPAPGRCQALCRCCRSRSGKKSSTRFLRPRTWEDDFRLACASGDVKKMEKLKETNTEDFNPDVPTGHGFTSLHAASLHGHDMVAKLLLEWRADADKVTDAQMSPLMFASSSGHQAVVELLLGLGAEIDTKHAVISMAMGLQPKSRTAHMFADEFEHEEIVELLDATAAEFHPPHPSQFADNASNASSGSKRSKSGSEASSKSSKSSASKSSKGSKQSGKDDDAASDKGSVKSKGSKTSKDSKGSKGSKGSKASSKSSEDNDDAEEGSEPPSAGR